MRITHIDHFNLTVEPGEIAALRDFYMNALGLETGPRPAFSFPGCWLYANGSALVHIAGKTGPPGSGQDTGRLNHIALACEDYEAAIIRLQRHGIAYRAREVPGQNLRQIFITDPAGLTLELNFAA